MALPAEQIKRAWRLNPGSLAHIMGLTLRDFGYTVADDWVKVELTRLMAGEPAKGGPSMFLAGWIKDGID